MNAELTNALINAKDTLAKLGSDEDHDVLRIRLLAKLELISIGANRAEVRAAIKQLEANRKNIQALSQ